MLLRRAVIAVGLTLAVAGAGAGTAAAGTGTAPGGGSSGLLDTVEKTVSSLAGGDEAPEKRSSQDQSWQNRQTRDTNSSAGGEGQQTTQEGQSSDRSRGLSSDGGGTPDLSKLTESDGPVLDVEGACGDGSLEGNAESCKSETLGNGYLNACVREDAGVVSDISQQTGLAEQAGLECAGDIERMPPPEDGEKPTPPDADDEPAPMPPPRHRAAPAEPAEPIVAEPTFTG